MGHASIVSIPARVVQKYIPGFQFHSLFWAELCILTLLLCSDFSHFHGVGVKLAQVITLACKNNTNVKKSLKPI